MEPIDPQTAKEVYQRACYTHLPKKPNPRLAWAAFEEHRGNIEEARRILKEFATDNPGYLMIEMRRLGLERRRILAKAANRAAGADADEDGAALTSEEFAEVSKIYESKIRDRSTKPKVATFYAVKYARFLAKVKIRIAFWTKKLCRWENLCPSPFYCPPHPTCFPRQTPC